MGKRKGKNPEISHLTIPPVLNRLATLRKTLSESPVGDPEERRGDIQQIDSWDMKARKALILLSLKGNEGIAMILAKIDEELQQIDEVIHSAKPTDMSPDGITKYANEQHAIFARRELWEWFRSLFTDAKRELREVDADLDVQEEDSLAPGE